MRPLWRLVGYVKPYAGRMLLATVLLSVAGALMAAVVATLKPLVNEVLLAGRGEPESADAGGPDILDGVRDLVPLPELLGWARDSAFAEVPLLLLVIFFVRSVLLYFGLYLTIKCGSCIIRDIRADLYDSVAYQSLDFFQRHSTGLIMARILGDVSRLQRITSNLLAYLLQIVGRVPFLLLTALLHEWRMTLFSLVVLPLLGYPMVRLGRRLRRASTASQESLAVLSSRLNESVSSVKVVQGFGMESYEGSRFGQALGQMLRADLKAGRAQSLSPAVAELLGAAVGATLFYVAGLNIARNNLDPGDFAVVLFCLGLIFVSIRRVNQAYAELQIALAASERVFEMMDGERTIRDRPGSRPLPPFSREIRFEHVDFSYGEVAALRDVDLTIPRGETVALVGSSGAGKSTLANLISRFYDPTRGRVLFDAIDIRDATVASVRSQVGLVTQETVLFDDTVRNNIAYGRADVPLERVVEVARAAQAHGFIERLPRGYDTVVGERGSRLSMGQRQRITIARALLKDPPILVLDEATSALDAESEALVQQALQELMRGRTSIVIAHRLATVRSADRIVVMEAGRIVEQGAHRELIARGGVYARLYELQFKESVT